jgi:hypothetical protein
MPWGLALFGALEACLRPLYRLAGQSLRASDLVYIWLCSELSGTRDKPLFIPFGENPVERVVCLTSPVMAYDGIEKMCGVVVDNWTQPKQALCPASCRTLDEHFEVLRTKAGRCRQLGQRIRDMASVSTFIGVSAAVTDARRLIPCQSPPSGSGIPDM